MGQGCFFEEKKYIFQLLLTLEIPFDNIDSSYPFKMSR
jgi:hypothetical protein